MHDNWRSIRWIVERAPLFLAIKMHDCRAWQVRPI